MDNARGKVYTNDIRTYLSQPQKVCFDVSRKKMFKIENFA